ncbi:coiled-coil-helix-coiled-coil-helix domain-containing protein 7 [Calliopsis andreniformis]|uniref:coiled-coil-helix-coiled-coil-helix domain-containing protein 7 n=1 Tax=Calliopsis andreniformis TaxID=337506 RepID=UPI003FCC4D43
MSTSKSHEMRHRKNSDAVNKFTRNQELYNPCLKEHNMSFKCLENNNFIQVNCAVYFENYKNCQYFWKKVMADRRMRGISPILPAPEEREKLKTEYLSQQKTYL